MPVTTAGQLLVNQILPPDLRDYTRVLDKKGVKALMRQVAEKYPDQYVDISKRLSDVGREIAYYTGGDSVGIDDLRPSDEVMQLKQRIREEIRQIEHDAPDDASREVKVLERMLSARKELADSVLADAKKRGNPLVRQLAGAGRGNANTLNSMLGGDVAYVDHKNNAIPLPVLHSYAEGLTPAEYFAGSFGARKGLVDLKAGTAQSGFMAKQLLQVAHRLATTADDDDRPYDALTPRGLPSDIDDPDNEGARLATDIGSYKRNTVLTPPIMAELKRQGIKNLLVRSPTVGGPEDGGVYVKDVGMREKGDPPIGDFVGIAAANALAEPITQMTISSKHSGGALGAQAGAIEGFKAIEALVNPADEFIGFASHSNRDGVVRSVAPAPQGGHDILVDGEHHYVPVGQKPTVEEGQRVEAGDAMSNGLLDPAALVQHKGIGEGRRYFIQTFQDLLKKAGSPVHRRNVELLARGLINHVRLTDELDEYGPDDVVPYQWIERRWEPRKDATDVDPQQAGGMYLEKPVLHYSVGTPIRPSVMKTMGDYGIKKITAHRQAPPFQAEVLRGMAQASNDPDWMTRMLGSYQQKSLLTGVHRGAQSDMGGSSFVPALAAGVKFDDAPATTGWDPKSLKR